MKPSERFKYLYNDEELAEWAEHIAGMRQQAKDLHVIFNNNYEDFAVRNARRIVQLLGL